MSMKCDHKKDGTDCLALVTANTELKNIKDLVLTLQKEAQRCQAELKDTKFKVNQGLEDYAKLSEHYDKEKELSSKLMRNNVEVQQQLNSSRQETALWSQQYFNFMQSTIKGSADAMVKPPQGHPMGKGLVKP